MRGRPASQSAFTARSLRMYLGCPREQECSASSAGFAGALLRLLASDGGAPAPRRPAARTASGGGFGRGAEPPSELLRDRYKISVPDDGTLAARVSHGWWPRSQSDGGSG